MSAQMNRTAYAANRGDRELDLRLERIGWGLFLAMVGGLLLLPEDMLLGGTWLIGSGLIVLGLNAVRYLRGINVSAASIVLGLLAIVAGLTPYLGITVDMTPIVLILAGIGLIAKQGHRQTA